MVVVEIWKKCRKISFVFLLMLGLTACMSHPQHLSLPIHSQSLLKQDFYTVDIPSFDGETIRATIYQPALAPHETAPLVIHAHGFGMFRMSSPVSIYSKLIFSGIAAKKAWDNGYWVISFDHRGHGGSGGHINMMDPEIEVRDLSWVLDWVENNVPRLTYRDSKPVVGMIGESYGGGLQLLSASLDDRINAIVPITTWHDFSSVLLPNNVVKSGWLTTLIAVGNMMNPSTMNRDFNSTYFKAMLGDTPSHFGAMMPSRSLSNNCYCRADAYPHADAFFIQGFRDVLFPVNEAVHNLECLEIAGRDVRLLATQNGHLLPMTQFARGLPGYDVDADVTCDSKRMRTDDMVLAWFDEKLKGIKHAADVIPKVCLTHDRHSGTNYDRVPIGGKMFQFHSAQVGSGFAGFFELPLSILDWVGSGLVMAKEVDNVSVPDEEKNNQSGTFRPVFVPLHNVVHEEVIAGIPIATFDVEGQENDIIFAGIGVKRNGSIKIDLMSDQVYPFRGGQLQRVELPAISANLKPGDAVGLVFSGYSSQYRLIGRFASRALISGEIELPLQ